MLCVLFMQCISYRYILVLGNIILSILADFYELNIWHAPASEIPVAIMTIPNARRAAAAAAAALLKAADCSSVRVIVLVADKRERAQTDIPYTTRIAATITRPLANVIMLVFPCC